MQSNVVHANFSSNNDDATVKTSTSQSHSQDPIDFVCPDKYELLGLIGSGGMGTVYKVRQKQLDKLMAIKMLLSERGSPDASARFQEEAKAASNLSHPNLLTFRDYGTTECGCPYLVMDYIEGSDLAKRIEEKGRLEIKEALEIFIQVFDGLAHAHERGVLHRDLKPANIMLSQEDLHTPVKIVDFGIAKARNSKQHLTKTGEVFGTPLYMSPEQGLGKPVDERSDIYSVGCVMFEALTGQPPFTGMSAIETIFMHQTAPIPTLRQTFEQGTFPPSLEKALAKFLAKDPADRPQSCQDARNILLELAGKASSKKQISPMESINSFLNKPWGRGSKSHASQTVLTTIESIIIKCVLIFAVFLTIICCVAILSK